MPTKTETALISRKLYTLGKEVWLPYTVDLGFRSEFRQKDGWYELIYYKGVWWLHLAKGFQWNGANFYPDWDFILIPSARHDVGHWLIEHGIISPWENNGIDQQLKEDLINSNTPIPFLAGGWIPKRVRAHIIGRATNLSNTDRRKGLIEHQSMFREIVI